LSGGQPQSLNGFRSRQAAPLDDEPALIPRGRKTGIHQAQVFRQRGYGRSVLIVEPHVQGVETGLWLSLRETILIEQSLQHELGRAGAIAIAAPSIASAETVEGPFS